MKGIFSKLYVLIIFAFFYLPILVMMIFSFNSSKSLTKFSGFSMRWYAELLNNNEVISAVIVSVTIAILATLISTMLGTLTAIGLSRSRKLLKEYLRTVNQIPIMNPEIVTAISLMLLFSSIGISKGYITMLLAHIAFCTPYVITSVYPKVRGLDPNLANAAMDLGATPFQALTKVVIPMIKPGVFAGALLAFTMSFDDFVISYFTTGNGVNNISIVVYNMTKRTNPTINALSTLVVIVIAVILFFVYGIPAIKSRMKRRIISLIIAFVIVAGCIAAINGAKKTAEGPAASDSGAESIYGDLSGRTIKVYNAGEYIDLNLIENFEKEYGCTVVYETFESNEMMYTKVASGESYDIIVPSDYMIERFIKEERLQPIEWDLIPNDVNLMDEVMGKDYDPENTYAVPYFWGTVGIIYNKNNVDVEDLESEGWNVLLNEKYSGRIYMYDSERDSFMVALKALGYSMNTRDIDEIREAYDWLIKNREVMKPIYVGDEVIDNMISENMDMAIVYSGDAAYMISENESLEYFTPAEGTNLWYDSMVIMKDCKEVTLAHAFINYMLDNENALANSEEVGYTSSVLYAFEEMKNSIYEGIDAYIPDVDNPNNEIFGYQEDDIKKIFADYWVKVKAN